MLEKREVSQECQEWQAGTGIVGEIIETETNGNKRMDIATLLHSLTLSGLTLRRGDADALEVVGPVQSLSLEQQQALRENKPTLLAMLTPPPTCFILDEYTAEAEREAIQFADTPEALAPLGNAIEFFECLADDMRAHNPEALSQVVLDAELQQQACKRCQSEQTYLAIIHAGESLRRDCASCGRFIDFPSWHNRKETGEILARTIEQSRYNTKADCSSAGNTQATLTKPLSQPKESR